MKKDKNENKNCEKEFVFLSEKIDGKKTRLAKLLALFISLAVIFGMIACATFFLARPFWKNLFGEIDDKKINDEKEVTMQEQEEPTTESMEDRLAKINRCYVTLAINDENEWKNVEEKSENYSSGVIIQKGQKVIILTNADFAKRSDKMSVYFGERRASGRLEEMYDDYGIAIISVNSDNINEDVYADIEAINLVGVANAKIGDEILYVGNPYGKEKYVAPGSLTSVTNAYNIVDAIYQVYNTDISINGMTNGFVFDTNGNIIGMIVKTINSSEASENVVSICTTKNIDIYLGKLIRGEKMAYVGIFGKTITDDVIENIDKNMPYGIYITGIVEKSPAYEAGIMSGDILVAINDKEVKDNETFSRVIHSYSGGDILDIKVMRKGRDGYKEFHYSVELGGI